MTQVIEANYPLTFRAEDAEVLGTHIRQHNSVSLIGMKRVGISNFLRFFLNHPDITSTYIRSGEHLFVVVDLNNLVERTLYAFWILTLKRLVDAIEASDFPEEMKEQSRSAFAQSIQLRDSFFALETVHKLINQIIKQGRYVTLFLLRFDRLKDVISAEFFANIQALKENTKQLSYVFTSYRPLYELVPEVFTRSELSVFVQEMYLKPAKSKDMKSILSTFQKRYDLLLSKEMVDELIRLSGGHVQYLQLSLIELKDGNVRVEKAAGAKAAGLENENLGQLLAQDEQLVFLSEELLSSLTKDEQEILKKVAEGGTEGEKGGNGKYLWETGMIADGDGKIFSPLFANYLQNIAQTHHKTGQELTKKEFTLFTLLQASAGNLVERETIVTTVWPEAAEFGVSDWSIDRLVSRVRTKLRAQGSEYRIVTVITRGYKLVATK